MSKAHWFRNTYWSCRQRQTHLWQSFQTKSKKRNSNEFVSHLCLHHEGSMHSQIVNNAVYVYNIFPFDLVDQPIDGYEGACAPHASTVGREHIHLSWNSWNPQFKLYLKGWVFACFPTCSGPQWGSAGTGSCALWPDVWSWSEALWFLERRDPARLWSGTDELNGPLLFLPGQQEGQ